MKSVTACLLLALGGCATRPIALANTAFGDAAATITHDGTIRLKVRSAGPDHMFRNGVITFKPGEPGYDALKAQVENPATEIRKPVFIWEVGTPVYDP
jgi:hypothetical protein